MKCIINKIIKSTNPINKIVGDKYILCINDFIESSFANNANNLKYINNKIILNKNILFFNVHNNFHNTFFPNTNELFVIGCNENFISLINNKNFPNINNLYLCTDIKDDTICHNIFPNVYIEPSYNKHNLHDFYNNTNVKLVNLTFIINKLNEYKYDDIIFKE